MWAYCAETTMSPSIMDSALKDCLDVNGLWIMLVRLIECGLTVIEPISLSQLYLAVVLWPVWRFTVAELNFSLAD